jgi:CheY-like chemotaxis protein
MDKDQSLPLISVQSTQKTILLIEDHPVFSRIFTHIISEHTQHQVIHLSDGLQIMQVMKEHRPHLLILDYELPGMNGIELYDLVHNTKGWEDIPAIMVSAGLPEREIRLRNIPGLRKPCSSGELLRAIERALTR